MIYKWQFIGSVYVNIFQQLPTGQPASAPSASPSGRPTALPSEYSELKKLVASDGVGGAVYGNAAAIDGNILVIGAYLHGGKGMIHIPNAALVAYD